MALVGRKKPQKLPGSPSEVVLLVPARYVYFNATGPVFDLHLVLRVLLHVSASSLSFQQDTF